MQIKAIQSKKEAYLAVTKLSCDKLNEANAATAERHRQRQEVIDTLACGACSQVLDNLDVDLVGESEEYEHAPIFSKEIECSASELPVLTSQDLVEGEQMFVQTVAASVKIWLAAPGHMAFSFSEFFCGPADCLPQHKVVGNQL